MSDACIIKSFEKGIMLVLDSEMEFEQLVYAICQKFASNSEFFGEKKLALVVEGRELTNEEISVVIEAIELNSSIKISYYMDNAYQAYKDVDSLIMDAFENAQIIPHSITNESKVHSDISVVVLGDVKRYAKLTAKGNVIVLGNIQGEVIAGCEGANDCFVVAGKIDALEMTIGNIQDEIIIKRRGLHFSKGYKEPIVVRQWQDGLLAEPLSSGLLSQR